MEPKIAERSLHAARWLTSCWTWLATRRINRFTTTQFLSPHLEEAIFSFPSSNAYLRRGLGQSLKAKREAKDIASAWLIHGDFLRAEMPERFDYVVGNPPYVRQELIPAPLLNEYRRRFMTLYDRADLYIPFIERSLGLLSDNGQLCFICSDRWMKNKYGGPLRALVARHYQLRSHIDMVDADAFHSEVSAYPAITVIAKGETGPTRVAPRPALDVEHLADLALALRSQASAPQLFVELGNVVDGSNPWILDSVTFALCKLYCSPMWRIYLWKLTPPKCAADSHWRPRSSAHPASR